MNVVRTYLTRIVVLIIALQILNLSVYSRGCSEEITDNTIGETNQIDSLTEYVAEILLDHKNAFPEDGAHNHHSNSLPHFMKHISFKIVSFKKNIVLPYRPSQAIAIPSKAEYKYMFSREIIPPPPKA